ncbi:YdcF family protein [Teichococcus vastitatis]|uniref:YdcF family protein n=1 Tax=Teichococcus vastitatis TaxID=2307076 RepID=A0ABS9W5C0_9PROT|nr:ElyC/SanA/YdcF family protein [Pseudoroseomonas vastitatis]MCI0754492.1 YdcF family protein [Pseudoroseomonas vastitatis]
MSPPLPDGGRRGHRSRLWLLPILFALALLGGFAFFAGLARQVPEAPIRPTDGVAVLTGGPQRVGAGLVLLAEGRARWLIISGVGPSSMLDELSRSAGLPAELLTTPEFAARITLGRAATSTRGNGAEIAEWVARHDMRSVRVVTAAFHMPRALLELRRVLPGVALVPHPVQTAGPRPGLLAREYIKLIGAMLGLSALKPE